MSLSIDSRIRSLVLSMGADYFGVADLGSARDFIVRQGGERISQYPLAVAVGIRLIDDQVDLLPCGDREGAILYRHSGYDTVNLLLDQIAVRLAGNLQKEVTMHFRFLHPCGPLTGRFVRSSHTNSLPISQAWGG